eukprot:1155998-Pelagomonas_calceolata.AAC.4
MLVSRHVPFAFAREHSLLQNRTLSRAISSQFPPESIIGVQEEVQLREQDFGNFQVGVFVRARARVAQEEMQLREQDFGNLHAWTCFLRLPLRRLLCEVQRGSHVWAFEEVLKKDIRGCTCLQVVANPSNLDNRTLGKRVPGFASWQESFALCNEAQSTHQEPAPASGVKREPHYH